VSVSDRRLAGEGRRRASPGRSRSDRESRDRLAAVGRAFFVALRGPRFDGRAFVGEAIGGRGACGALVQIAGYGGDAGVAGAALVEVDDTTRALQDLARAVRAAAGTRVVAITGSAGKTTTKDTIADFLSTGFVVVKNKGNLNNHIGCRCR
jgi:UDP-N-acetylmuramoyl-tripeptide--D-alanyl-D-alanine ligase